MNIDAKRLLQATERLTRWFKLTFGVQVKGCSTEDRQQLVSLFLHAVGGDDGALAALVDLCQDHCLHFPIVQESVSLKDQKRRQTHRLKKEEKRRLRDARLSRSDVPNTLSTVNVVTAHLIRPEGDQ